MITDERQRAIHRRIAAILQRQIAEATSIRDIWMLYEAAILPAAADSDACRRSFYTGAAAALDLFFRVAAPDVDEDAGIDRIEAIRLELADFSADLKGGRQ
jgi:type III secretory pathway component EscV